MNQKHWQKIYHANVNECFTAANVTGIKIGITINVGVHGVHVNIKITSGMHKRLCAESFYM